MGNRPFLADLYEDSPAIQAINEEFRHHAHKLQLYSYYETRPTSFGPLASNLIVRKTSAVIGYGGERSASLDADHRGICKFDSPSDSNFVALKYAFMETIDKITEQCTCLSST
jgi:hypothetical protein